MTPAIGDRPGEGGGSSIRCPRRALGLAPSVVPILAVAVAWLVAAGTAAGWSVRGRVVDGLGDGLVDRPVVVQRVTGTPADVAPQAAPPTRTDEAGRFAVEVAQPAWIVVRVGDQQLGPLPVVRDVELPLLTLGSEPLEDPAALSAELSPTRWRSVTGDSARSRPTAPVTVVGRVVDAVTRQPIRGALVRVGAGDLAVVVSGHDGRFSIVSPNRPTFAEAAASGRLWRRLAMPSGEMHGTAEVEIRLWPTVTGRGVVRDLGERPIPGAVIEAESRPDQRWQLDAALGFARRPRRAIAGPDGEFSFTELPAGRLDLVARADGFAPLHVPGVEVEPSAEAPAGADLGVVLLEAGRVWHGRVIDDAGRPLIDEAIRFRRLGSDETSWQVAAEGVIVVRDLAAGERVDLEVSATGYRPTQVPITARDGSTWHEVVLSRLALLRGRVVDPAGTGIAARVEAAAANGREPTSVHSQADGRFEIRVDAGRVTLSAFGEGFGPSASVVAWADPERDVDDVELALREALHLAGNVVDADGTPVADAEVVADLVDEVLGNTVGNVLPATGPTDGDGGFRIPGVVAGTVRLTVEHPDLGTLEHTTTIDAAFEGDGSRLELVYPPAVAVVGQVVDSAGRGVAGATIRLRSATTRSRSLRGTVDGRFRFPAVATGVYELIAEASGFAPSAAVTVRVDEAPPAPVEVVVAAGARLRAQVTGLGIEDLGITVVEAVAADGRTVRASPDHHGTADLGAVAAGLWQLQAVVGDGRRRVDAEALIPVDLAASGAEVEVDLVAGRGATMLGTVSHGRRPLAGARVLLMPRQGRSIATATDSAGGFEVPDLVSGRYQLEVQAISPPMRVLRELDWVAGEAVAIELASGRLVGRVERLGSERSTPGLRLQLTAMEPGDGMRAVDRPSLGSVPIGHDGRFRIDGLVPGRYRVSVGGFQVEPEVVAITESESTVIVRLAGPEP